MLAPGTNLGGYRIEGLLGRGGMGVVYEATQVSLHRLVALKLLTPELGLDASFRTRFQREGRIQAAIDHAHIVPIYDSGEIEGQGLFIAMRLVRGPTLKELILSGELEPQRALRILGPVADALDTAHEAELVHRDIKPQNILVGPRDHAYLADFGLTRAPGDTAFTKTGQFVGTLDYIAPEQIRGEPPAPASDVYSLAGVAFECLTGSVPFPRPTEASVMFAHISDPPPRASELREGLPARVDEVLARAMAKDPAERPATALSFVQELADAVPQSASKVSRPMPPPVAAPPPAEATAQASTLADLVPAPTDTVPSPPETVPSPAPAIPPPAPAPVGQVTEPRSRVGSVGMSTIADQRRPWPDEGAAAHAPPAPPRRAPVGRRRAALGVAAAAVVGLGVAAGAIAHGGGSGTPEAPPPPRPGPMVAGDSLAVRAPAGWRAVAAPDLPGLPLKDAHAAAPSADAAAGMVVGTSAATGASLLPQGLTSRLAGEPATVAVKLGDLRALRHGGLRPRGYDRPLTVFAIPTTGGVATLACLGGGAALKACEAAATKARLATGVRPYPLGPRGDYAKSVTRVVERLDADRRAALADWRRARTRRGQGSAAAALAAAYAAAARSMQRLKASPLETAVQADAASALSAAGAALRSVSRAADHGDGRAYQRAVAAVGRHEAAAAKAIGKLDDVGYRVA